METEVPREMFPRGFATRGVELWVFYYETQYSFRWHVGGRHVRVKYVDYYEDGEKRIWVVRVMPTAGEATITIASVREDPMLGECWGDFETWAYRDGYWALVSTETKKLCG